MRNVRITTSTLADLVRRSNRFASDIDQFHEDIWIIKAVSFDQLAVATRAFLATYEEQKVDAPVMDAARYYLTQLNGGDLGNASQRLLETATAFLTAVDPTDVLLDLVKAATYSRQLEVLWWGPLFALRNRARNFNNMTARESALSEVFADWIASIDGTPEPLPTSPFGAGTVLHITGNTFKDMLERNVALAEDIPAFADDVLAIRAVSCQQLSEAARVFQSPSHIPEEAPWTRLGKAAYDFLTYRLDDRGGRAKNLLDAARNHRDAFGETPEIVALITAAQRCWDLYRLSVQTEELNKRAAKFSDIRKLDVFRTLSTVFENWEKSQNSEPAKAA